MNNYSNPAPEPQNGEVDTQPYPNNPQHYHNYPAVLAVQALHDILNKFRNLTCIPFDGGGHMLSEYSEGV